MKAPRQQQNRRFHKFSQSKVVFHPDNIVHFNRRRILTGREGRGGVSPRDWDWSFPFHSREAPAPPRGKTTETSRPGTTSSLWCLPTDYFLITTFIISRSETWLLILITCRQGARWGIIWNTSGSKRTGGTWRWLWSICSLSLSWVGCRLSDFLDKYQTHSREDLPGHSRWVRTQCCVEFQTLDTPPSTFHWSKLFLV